MRENAKHVYIIKSDQFGSTVILNNLDEFVKSEERGKEARYSLILQDDTHVLGTVLSTRLQIKRWLRENVIEFDECPDIQNSHFQQIRSQYEKDLRLVNLKHLAKCFRDLNFSSPANTSCKGNSIIVLDKR